jgi:Arc/MetJ family transcription regulator
MATNLGLDDKVVEEAVELGRHKSKREAVMAALLEYIRRRQQMRIFELEGKIDYDPRYDHRASRKKKR